MESIKTFNHLKIEPYEVVDILNLEINRKINSHGELKLKCVISDEKKDSYVKEANFGQQIKITVDSEVFFQGIVTNIKVQKVGEIFYLDVEAKTNTYVMDLREKKRSFQNKNMTYAALIHEVIKEYQGSDFIDKLSYGDQIKNWILQYEETDWEFLKRIASNLEGALIADTKSGKPKFWFGANTGNNKGLLSNYNYSLEKEVESSKKKKLKFGKKPEVQESYIVESESLIEVGEEVTFQGKKLYVQEAKTHMEKGVLKNLYVLVDKKKLKRHRKYNEKFQGISMLARVLKVEKDEVKVHLEIDQEQKEAEAWNFKYATPYSAEKHGGWYCMPELGDYVHVYIPNKKEEEGYASNSFRMTREDPRIFNPDVKYFRTKDGKELRFTPEGITITAKDNQIFIDLNDKGGIQIFSAKSISLSAQENISINSGKKINIAASESISMKAKDSDIKMDSIINLHGQEIRVN